MRHALAPLRGELEDREGEDEWIIVVVRTAINPVSFKQSSQTAGKKVDRWYNGEDTGVIVAKNRAI